MLRSVKYGLCGAILAGAVGGSAALTTTDSTGAARRPVAAAAAGKTVHLVVDGQSRTVHTVATAVGQVVTAAGYHPGAHDLLAPSASAPLRDGSTIILRRARLLRLDVDGSSRNVWTTAPTVAQALEELGFTTKDFTSVSRSRRLPLGATDISVRMPKSVTVIHDGRRSHVTTTDATVGQLITDLSLKVGSLDRLSVPKPSLLSAGATITLTRVVHKTLHDLRPLPFKTTTTNDPTLASGNTRIVNPGRTGVLKTTWAAVYVDGKLIGKTKIASTVVRAPIGRVQKVGTLQPPPVRTATPAPRTFNSGTSSPNPAPVPSTGSPKDIARSMLSNFGWGQDQFGCLDQMWTRESGWRVNAANPSGAYGIPQALPGSKMGSAGPDWQNNAATQIRWGLGYIASRYNSPCQAWSIWQSQGWY